MYTYEPVPGVPPISTLRFERGSIAGIGREHAHAHDFLVLCYFDRGGGSLRVGDREWRARAGDVYLVAPGEVVGAGADHEGLGEVAGWCAYFPPEGLGPEAPDALLSWRAHPLLLPFVRGAAAGMHRLSVPSAQRASWSSRFEALDRELGERRDGYPEAAIAHLTLLLVDVARLAADVVADLRLRHEPLLAEVFGYIEAHYDERISLRDVAAAVSLTPGHLTTVVRRRTGRTVQDWIAERRMAQARRLLVESDATVAEIARRIGYDDPGYFARTFKRSHGATPLRWRRAGRR